MREDATPATTPRLVFGLLIVAVGLLFTLDNLGLAEAHDILRYWPAIFIALGVARLWSGFQRAKGVLWIVLGLVLLLPVVSDEIELQDLVERWPLFLIGLGVYFVWRSFAVRRAGGLPHADRPRPGVHRPDLPQPGVPPVPPPGRRPGLSPADLLEAAEPSPSDEPAPSPTVSLFSFLSSAKKTVDGPGFRRGEATALLGGCELDLRGAELDPDGAVIEVLAFWGGITLRVPPGWPVELEANVLMGASEDNTRRTADGKGPGEKQVGIILRLGEEEKSHRDPGTPDRGELAPPRLTVRGFVLMGGIEVRN